MNVKGLLAVILAAAASVSTASSVFALDDKAFGTEQTELFEVMEIMTDTEKEEYINENLDVKLRYLSNIVTLTSNRNYSEIASVVNEAIDNGVTAVEIKEAIFQAAPYCGYTRAAKAMDAADAALGGNVPVETRTSVTDETRYDEGLKMQRAIFGPIIGTITDDMTGAAKLQTVYLSGICFGDFYTRAGLSLTEREFLTLCAIAGNGGCSSQVGSHIMGNVGVGNNTDMLRAAVLANAQYNGDEKTVIALGLINSMSERELGENPGIDEPTAVKNADYTTDTAEITAMIEHYKDDDADGYIDANLDSETQEIIINAAQAVIDAAAVPKSDDEKIQTLIDLAVLAADGTRADEFPTAVKNAVDAGNTADTMLAAALVCVPYNGFPRTLNATAAINSAVSALDTDDAPEMFVTDGAQTVVMNIGNPIMTVDGTKIEIDEGRGTTPIIENDRTLLPVRAFIEAIGGEVSWDDNTRTTTLTYNGNEIKLTIDSTTAYLNGAAHSLDVTPIIRNDRTMLPIRFIAESFGYTVGWDQDRQEVAIRKGIAETIAHIFEQGNVNPFGPVFTGTSYLSTLISNDEIFNAPGFSNVTFEPCTRTDWHTHGGGQILLVTEGTGLYQEEGKPARFMKPGDVIMAEPNVKHFHGASKNSWFAHIAIGTNPGQGMEWLEPVSDEQYTAAYAEALENDIERNNEGHMFPMGEPNPLSQYFTGQTYLQLLIPNDKVFNCPAAFNVTFEECARTDWHSHDGGQILIVTEGEGLHQIEGQSAAIMKPGDVIKIEPGVKHWHGASKNGTFAHIVISTNPDNGGVNWQEKVTDEEYETAYSEAVN